MVLLPVTVGCILYLGNRKDLMCEYRHSTLTNLGLIGLFLFALFTGYIAWQGLSAMLTS